GSGLSGGVGGSGSSGGVGTVPHPAAVTTSQRRRIDPSCLDKLPGDASLSQLRSWTNRWNDFSQLNQLSVYPVNEQMAAFRMVLDPAMHQVVEVALGISPTSVVTPADVLDQIKDYIRSKRNIALDRVAFEECKQGTTETFDEFYIRLKNLAEAANLCIACLDERMATRIMAGIQDAETKRRLLAISPFPTSQQTINICRSEESARANERSLSGPASVAKIQLKHQRQFRQSEVNKCGSCGRPTHHSDEPCPAIGKQCHNCGNENHFAPCCPMRSRSSAGHRAGGSGSSGGPGGSGSSGGTGSNRSRVNMKRVVVGNVSTCRRRRPAPTIPMQICEPS
ncbi:Uncharacterized protein APZ42_000982, partial [Daphnia magna]